ncbi:SAM-dependent methyltransferase [Robiginitalea sp.]|nr:SAM-dependent methyltransferase [Robiginitalea sp.]
MGEQDSQTGKLYLIPTLLGDTEPLEVLPIRIKQVVEELNYFIVEHERSARRFIKKLAPRKSQDGLNLFVLNKFTEPESLPLFIEPCFKGNSVGILSEAGCPGIADPGASVVKLAHENDIKVIPLVGPSSILLALMASGMNGQSFAFHGYLPIEPTLRKKKIRELERQSTELGQTQLFIETPFRNQKLFSELLQNLRKHTRICIAVDITLKTEFIKTLTVAQWQDVKPDLHKRPAIFLIQG